MLFCTQIIHHNSILDILLNMVISVPYFYLSIIYDGWMIIHCTIQFACPCLYVVLALSPYKDVFGIIH